MFKQSINPNSDNKNLGGIVTKISNGVKTYQSDIVLAMAVILISIISFNLGKISALRDIKTPVAITEPANMTETSTKASSPLKPALIRDQSVIASKQSKNKVYHFSWCPGASKIAERNKITFTAETAAIAAGYTLAGNCTK